MTPHGVDPHSVQRLVLKHKTSRKISSRRDQGKLALKLEAHRLNDTGLGGGIVSSLLPATRRGRTEIAALGKIYDAVRVIVRPVGRKKMTDRQATRAALEDNALVVQLAEAYRVSLGKVPGAHTISAKAFFRWLYRQLQDRKSPASIAVRQRAPVLLDRHFGDRWLADALARRRKPQS